MWVSIEHCERGRGHIKNDIPCQDKTFSLEKNGCKVIALADGAGSAKLSHIGAECATKCICEYLCQSFEETFSNDNREQVQSNLIDNVLEKLVTLSNELNCDVKDLACTLLAVAVRDEKYILIHCGDGISGYMRGFELKIGSKPINGEFSNQTVFVTSEQAKETVQIFKGILNDIRGFALMTDGCEICFYDKTNSKLSPIIGQIINDLSFKPVQFVVHSVAEFFKNIVVNYKSNNDDSSMIVMAKRNSTTSNYHELSEAEKYDLFSIKPNSVQAHNALKRTEIIISLLQTPMSLIEISKFMKVKEKHMKKKLNRLIKRGCVELNQGKFFSKVVL